MQCPKWPPFIPLINPAIYNGLSYLFLAAELDQPLVVSSGRPVIRWSKLQIRECGDLKKLIGRLALHYTYIYIPQHGTSGKDIRNIYGTLESSNPSGSLFQIWKILNRSGNLQRADRCPVDNLSISFTLSLSQSIVLYRYICPLPCTRLSEFV